MSLISFFLGGRRVGVGVQNATAFLNLCLQYGISYSAFSYEESGAVFLCCSLLTVRRLRRLCKKHGIALECGPAFGLPALCYRHRKRAGLLLGMLLSAVLTVLSQKFVWDVRVEGNFSMSREEVLEELAACGFGVGSYIPDFRAGELENRVLIHSDRIAWISVYMDGTVARVQVVERDTAPSLEDSSRPANLVAAFDGQIETLELFRGNCLVCVGQAVKKGDLLVSGVYDSQTQGVRYTRASGKVFARTRQTVKVEIPLFYEEKVYGEEKRGDITLNFFGFSTKILKSTGNVTGSCDIIEVEKESTLPGGASLPVGITVTSYRPYELRGAERTHEEALELAYRALEAELKALPEDTLLLKKSVFTTLTEGSVILECDLLCIMNIACQVEFEIAD